MTYIIEVFTGIMILWLWFELAATIKRINKLSLSIVQNDQANTLSILDANHRLDSLERWVTELQDSDGDNSAVIAKIKAAFEEEDV